MSHDLGAIRDTLVKISKEDSEVNTDYGVILGINVESKKDRRCSKEVKISLSNDNIDTKKDVIGLKTKTSEQIIRKIQNQR